VVILDAFLYAGERDMLDLRLATLKGAVDEHLAIICTTTHQGDPVDIEPPPCQHRYFTPTPVEGGNEGHYFTGIETQHRDYIRTAARGFYPDIVLVSDLDEIPRPDYVDEIAAAAAERPVSVPMRMHGFALDYLYEKGWVGTTASHVDMLNPQAHRDWRGKLPRVGSGWHLSWMGSMEDRKRKARSFTHNEHADIDVEHCWRNGIHVTEEIGVLKRLTPDEFDALSWPALDAITVPDGWRAPPLED
jgi:hypothetical protein